MASGAIALATAAVIGVHWYYGLQRLVPTGASGSATAGVGRRYVIDEQVEATGGSALIDLRSVAVRLGANTAGATAIVELCAGYASVDSCDSPVPFRAQLVDLTSERIVVVVRGAHPGAVEVAGIDVSYRDGVRSATQHVGPDVTVTVQ